MYVFGGNTSQRASSNSLWRVPLGSLATCNDINGLNKATRKLVKRSEPKVVQVV